MQAEGVFGYGSLVNRATLAQGDARPARLRGWRRAWRRSPLRKIAYLTAIPDPAGELWGLVAPVRPADWPALAERERAYAAHDVTDGLHPRDTARVVIFAMAEGAHLAPGPQNPVLLSYVDTVMLGYLAEFGTEGLAHFLETTEGWDKAPILDDRAAPRYPRHQLPTDRQRALFDRCLGDVGARLMPDPGGPL